MASRPALTPFSAGWVSGHPDEFAQIRRLSGRFFFYLNSFDCFVMLFPAVAMEAFDQG
jgi:hypothetical protein